MRLVSELKRRNVLRMAVLYTVAAWLIMQVAEVLIDLAKLPDWIGTTTLWLLAIGFPIALIFSWFYELTPEGISLEQDVDAADSITHITGRRLDFVVISLLCAAVILFSYDKWWASSPPKQSIAVLPFVNMSDDISNEYFSDGISEELLNLLARVPELRVVSRTSAFFYKGKNMNLATVARELNVAHILEGSVRKAGDQVRITVQLIEARSDTHLWSQMYDRSLDDIFSVQDEIAKVVVEELKVTLLGNAPELEETDPEAYALVLQSAHFRRLQTPDGMEQALSLLNKALSIDPNYARAWVELALTYLDQVFFDQLSIENSKALALEAVDHALMLNPDFASAHRMLGYIAKRHDSDLSAAAYHYQRAMELDPSNISGIANLLSDLGRLDEAIVFAEEGVSRDPVNANSHFQLGHMYLSNGYFDEALDSFRTALKLNPGRFGASYAMGLTLLLKNEPKAGLAAFEREPDEIFRARGTALAFHDLGHKTEFEAAMNDLRDQWSEKWPSEIAMVSAWVGDKDTAFQWLEKEIEVNGTYGWAGIPDNPILRNLHDDLRWQPLLTRVGVSAEQLAAIEFMVTLPE